MMVPLSYLKRGKVPLLREVGDSCLKLGEWLLDLCIVLEMGRWILDLCYKDSSSLYEICRRLFAWVERN